MKKLKVMTIVGTRPEIIKLSRVIAELELHTEHTLVHSGQNYDYELNEIFFNDLEIKKPDYFLNVSKDSAIAAISDIIMKSDEIFAKENPDAVLIYGDTNTALSVISAKKRKIPIFHMEAGNRCFDQRVPEEINRKIVDHLSDINMPLTEHAREYLLREGIKPETIIKTGSSMLEIFNYYSEKIDKSNVLDRLNLEKKSYFVVSAHREENVDSERNLNNFINTLERIAEIYNMPIIVSTHPRTRKKLENREIENLNSNITFMKPLGFFDYIKLQKNSFCVISDSGTITEESSILKFPAITIREAHERPEGMDEGAVIMSGLDSDRVLQAIDIVTKQNEKSTMRTIIDYQIDNVSKKVVRVILSYTDYINRFVWRKFI
ncbi:UDP-N-acetylglucosamine 2-epimerase (non-hydrolyzing) [bacterium]|nr:UDP-N-acetylglucosamine 2-epimerase (non-hydrolyzing) [bacterium]